MISAFNTSEAGFYDDNDFDGSDLMVFLAEFNNCNIECNGDFVGDGDVDQVDLDTFASNFGKNNCILPEVMSEIGTEGGIVDVIDPESPIYGIQIEVPDNALNVSKIISAGVVDSPRELPGDSERIGECIELGPDGTNFYEPISISIPYLDDDDDGIIDNTNFSEYDVSIKYFNENFRQWEALSISQIDGENNIVYAETNHFTTIANSAGDDYGNSCNQSYLIELNNEMQSTIIGQIKPVGEFDYFKINITETGYLTAYTSGNLDTKGYIKTANCSDWAFNDNKGGLEGDNFFIRSKLDPGTWYIAVTSDESSNLTGKYKLMIEFVPEDYSFIAQCESFDLKSGVIISSFYKNESNNWIVDYIFNSTWPRINAEIGIWGGESICSPIPLCFVNSDTYWLQHMGMRHGRLTTNFEGAQLNIAHSYFILEIGEVATRCHAVDSLNDVIYQPGPSDGKDCTVKESHPDINYNNSVLGTGVQTSSNGRNNYSFIQFDISDLPSNPSSVILKLRNSIYQRADQGGFYITGTLNAHRVTGSWNEGDATWSTMPNYDSGVIANSDEFDIVNDEWVEVDITSVYNDWKSGTPNYGLMLNTNDSDTAGYCGGNREYNCRPGSFYSSDYTDNPDYRPALVIVP